MKYKTSTIKFLVLIFLCPIFVEAQSYIPFPDSNAVWKETYWWELSPLYYNGIGDTYLLGDTVINDTTYRKIYNIRRDVFCSDIILNGPDYYGALREDTITKKVYYRWQGFSGEKLLYDYTLEVGDTLPLEMDWFTFDYYGIYVKEIDTITTIDGIDRRVWHLDHVEPFPGWPQIVEGIGSTSGLLGGIEPYWEGWNELLCFSVNNNVAWYSFRETCYVITDACAPVGVIEVGNPEEEVFWYPNPVNKSTTVYFKLNKKRLVTGSLMIFDLFGNKVSSVDFYNNNFAIASPTKNGVYIIKLIINNNNYVGKLIVTN